MKKIVLFICMIFFLISFTGCSNAIAPGATEQNQTTESASTESSDKVKAESVDGYSIAENGDLLVTVAGKTSVLKINALPDGQMLEDEHGRLLVLCDPSDRYQHGILGDSIEPTSVTLINIADEPFVISSFSVPTDWVIESIRPVWRDWDGDGNLEIVLTLSNASLGAKLALYDESGNLLAESEPIGRGFRWRHALDIATFGENGELILVDVVTPHIGGIVNFYSWDKDNNSLKVEASLSGYSTHDIGSRAMDMFALVSYDSTGQVLLIVPTQSKKELAALSLVSGAIQEEWRLPLDGKLTGDFELVEIDGGWAIKAVVDGEEEVFNLPE